MTKRNQLKPRKRRGKARRATRGSSNKRAQANGGSKSQGRGIINPPKINVGEVISRGMPAFSSQRRCMLRYFDGVTVTSTALAAGNYVFSANGIYDPDITGTGHQPMAFDQMMLSYEHYVVLNARITIQTRNNSTTLVSDIAISARAAATPVTNVIQICENGILVRDRLNSFPYDGSAKTLTLPLKIGRFGGVPNVLDDPEYQGTVAANPAEQSYFHISAWNYETSTTIAVWCEVTIEYDVVFREPRQNGQSLVKAMHALLLASQEDKKC